MPMDARFGRGVALEPLLSGRGEESASHQLSKRRLTRLVDNLRHLSVGPLGDTHHGVRHQQRQLRTVKRSQAQQPLEHRQDVNDQAGLVSASTTTGLTSSIAIIVA